ncbi:hypothetical protein PHISCL_05741 [Aspergillus sclerotialis]|uniref:Uncharacterized protein n=1 Tax=Aspergillus sclerotialis TaxID=2070753 RepID=A0A3A2ZG11_9EURO|nr:hypothetical protein PHISCL_05741 [Aspergillus sclerotialis]
MPPLITPPDTTKRRRFQPPITSFFTSTASNPQDDFSPSVSHNHYSATTYSPMPVVSAKTQSNLLNAGMRVRKAVAEGYKTKPMSTGSDINPMKENKVLRTTSHAELAPFCGIVKSVGSGNASGDLGVNSIADPGIQSNGNRDALGYSYEQNHVNNDDGDAFSLPSSSQNSESAGSVSITGVKRGFEDELDDDSDLTSSLNPSYSACLNPNPMLGRTILTPGLGFQRRLHARQSHGQAYNGGVGMDMDDFENAEFLLSRDEVW